MFTRIDAITARTPRPVVARQIRVFGLSLDLPDQVLKNDAVFADNRFIPVEGGSTFGVRINNGQVLADVIPSTQVAGYIMSGRKPSGVEAETRTLGPDEVNGLGSQLYTSNRIGPFEIVSVLIIK